MVSRNKVTDALVISNESFGILVLKCFVLEEGLLVQAVELWKRLMQLPNALES